MAAAALAGLIGLLLLLSLLPLWRHPAWWIRGLDFPRLQIACGLAALLLVSAFVLEPARPLHLSLLLAALGGLVEDVDVLPPSLEDIYSHFSHLHQGGPQR